MRVLLITPLIPYPLTEGGKISQYAVIDRLRKLVSVTLTVPVYHEEELQWVEHLKNEWPDVNIIAINLIFRLNIKGKIAKLIISFKNACLNLYYKKSVLPEIQDPNINNVYRYLNKDLINRIANIIEECKPELIQIDIVEYLVLAFIIPKHIKKVFVHHEIRFARLESSVASYSVPATLYEQLYLDMVKSQEISLLKLYDSIFVFSQDDEVKLKAELPEHTIQVAPFPVLDKNFINIDKQNLTITKLVFIGSENHTPNKDAVEWYINELGADIFAQTKLKLYITGSWSDKFLKKYSNNILVNFTGFLPDLVEFCRNSILLVPVRIGSGIRTKIIYAMAQGVPVISASIGLEGIPAVPNEEVLVANTKKDFLEAILKVKNNTEFTYNMVLQAQKRAYQLYSQQENALRRVRLFEEILNK